MAELLSVELESNRLGFGTFEDRRRQSAERMDVGVERRQFANTYADLSDPAKELAQAIDSYKLQHRRRFITYEEMYSVIVDLGYRKSS